MTGRPKTTTTYNAAEIDDFLDDKLGFGGLGVILDGNGSNLPGYAKKTDLDNYALAAGNVDTTTDNYLRRTVTYLDSMQVNWFQSGEEKQMILVNLSAFHLLEARVTALEAQVANNNNSLITAQSNIFNVTQQAQNTATAFANFIANL